MTKRVIIYIPGLNDHTIFSKVLTKFLSGFWKRYGYEFYTVNPHWKEGELFAPKLNEIIKKIDELSSQGNKIYLFGVSAGGSAVLNAFVHRKSKISAVVNIGGRLRKGQGVFPSLHLAAKGNPAFEKSVLLFENKNEKLLTINDKKKVLTIRPVYDEIVPAITVSLDGALNCTCLIPEHTLGAVAAITVFSKRVRSFLHLHSLV